MSSKLISEFDRKFVRLHQDRSKLARDVGDGFIYRPLVETENSFASQTIPTLLIRSAAVVEQVINGMTVRLWDDPFEWTLPEGMPTIRHLTAYFDDVERARVCGFRFLQDDSDLTKSIPAPVELRTLHEVLVDVLQRSHQLLNEAETHMRKTDSLHL
jgi:hypothetical protein